MVTTSIPFECRATYCKAKGKNGQYVRQNLNTHDAMSTRNLRNHAKICWGEETVESALKANNVHTARAMLAEAVVKDGSITAAFEQEGKGRITYSHQPYTKAETQCVILNILRILLIHS